MKTYFRWAEIEERLNTLSQAMAKDGIKLVCLFGSILEQPVARDIDLAVLFREYSFDKYLETLEVASSVLQTNQVDLVVLNRVDVLLKLRALLAGKVIYAETEMSHAEAVEEAFFEYEDFRRFMVEYRFYLDKRCQEGLSVAERKIDRERVERYLSLLDEGVLHLRRLQRRFNSFEEFQSDVDTRELCIHYLRIILEGVLDICRHFLAVVGLSLAELETTNLIELAGEKGLLEPAFARRIRGMVGMRNAIVHVYWRLDYEAIYRAITEQLADVDEFARQVQAYLGREP